MPAKSRLPVDLSQLPSYLERELESLAKEIDSYATKRIIPVWVGATTNPVLGNGSLVVRYKLTADLCEYWLRLVAGSTTTFGTGEWTFQLPAAAKDFAQCGSAHLLDAGTNRFAGACEVLPGTTVLRVFAHGSLNSVRNNVPFTWAVNDELHAHIRYLR
jgi:hypothetical protein